MPYAYWPSCVVRGPVKPGAECDPLGYPYRFLDIGDFDGDHLPDLLSSDGNAWAADTMTLELWTEQRGTRELFAPDYGWVDAHFLERGTVTPALLVAAKGGRLNVYAGDAHGALAPGAPVSVQTARELAFVDTEDLDGDGIDEILGVTPGSAAELWVLRACK